MNPEVRVGSIRRPSGHQRLTEDDQVWQHSDEEFQTGIPYKARFIGTLEINKPNNKADIILAMRRTRQEFRDRRIKKMRVLIIISVEGVKVVKRPKRRRNYFRSTNQYEMWNEEEEVINTNPIYKIFYVSHDSRDKKIYSYIYRDTLDDSFKCSVFKGRKKRHSLRCVRTIGQAFEVCHKLNPPPKKPAENGEKKDETEDTVDSKEGEKEQEPIADESKQLEKTNISEDLLVDISDTQPTGAAIHLPPPIQPTTVSRNTRSIPIADPWHPVDDQIGFRTPTTSVYKIKPNVSRPLIQPNPFAEGGTNPFSNESVTSLDLIAAAEELGLSPDGGPGAEITHLSIALETTKAQHKEEMDKRIQTEALLRAALEQSKELKSKVSMLEQELEKMKLGQDLNPVNHNNIPVQ